MEKNNERRKEMEKQIVINNVEDMEKYFNEENNSFEFFEGRKLPDVKVNFNLQTNKDIVGGNITFSDGKKIIVKDVRASSISARGAKIKARDINVAGGLEVGDIDALGDITARKYIRALNITALNIKTLGPLNTIDITALDISAQSIVSDKIKAHDIDAQGDIQATSIMAKDISFYALCFAYGNIICKSIRGVRHRSIYFSLDGEVFVNGEKKDLKIRSDESLGLFI